MQESISMSTLNKTWILDLDGTILKHNGYKIDGFDTLLPGAKEYIDEIPDGDRIIILTSRTREYRKQTLDFLRENGIRYDDILFDIPYGERIVINDRKPSGLSMAVAIDINRDNFDVPQIVREK